MEDLYHSRNIIQLAALKSIGFDFLTGRDIEKFGSVSIEEICDLTSSRLGLPNPSSECETCGSSSVESCHGHSGFIKLPAVIYHPYFITEIARILNHICPGCKSVRHMHMKMLGKGSYKWQLSYRLPGCKYCSKRGSSEEWYPKMKFKVVRDKSISKNLGILVEVNERLPRKFKDMTPSEALAKDYWDFVPHDMHQPEPYCSMAMSLSPSQAFSMLVQLEKEFIERYVPRRELLFLSSIPVTSNCHRVTERILPHVNGAELVFDQRTNAYKSLLSSKRKVDDLQVNHHPYGGGISKAVGNLAYNCLNLSNLHPSSSLSKEKASKSSGQKWMKDVVLGKRSDHTFSMVVVGDPKIKLWEIGIPSEVADRLVVSDTLTSFNKDVLRKSNLHYSCRKDNSTSKRNGHDHLNSRLGDVKYRSLRDGDIVLINRPPSVHQHSLISLRVKILPVKSVVSINPLCCSPFKGDFDGDFLLGYIPQSIQCRVELGELVGLECQLFDGQDGKSLLSLSHDSLTAAYLLTGADVFLNKFEIQQLQMLCPRQSTLPAIFGSTSQMSLWTGQQLFSSLLPATFGFSAISDVVISKGEILHLPPNSSWLKNSGAGIFSSLFKLYGRNALDFLFSAQDVLSEWISCRGFSVTLNDLYLCSDKLSRNKLIDEVECGLQEAKDAFHLKSIVMEPEIGYLVCMGHERDCSRNSKQEKEDFEIKSIMMDPEIRHLLNNSKWYHDLAGLGHLIRCSCYQDPTCVSHQIDWSWSSKLKSGFMKKHTAAVSGFKEVFQDILNIIHRFARKDNSLLQMIHAGSKGSFSKLFQQSACVGLQHISNLSFLQMSSKFDFGLWNHQSFFDALGAVSVAAELERTNPCTVVQSSFLDGLNPRECLLHATSSRANSFGENAELPGTLNRKLMFVTRDLYLAYDGTVRNYYGQQIVQFSYANSEVSDITDVQMDDSCKLSAFETPKGLYGSPVGALASCSISEAAYGGLDQPASSFDSSPLTNLKKLLSNYYKHKTLKRMVSLALSKKLNRWSYGFEYAALEIQRHLERVLLSDVVNTVLIVYSGREVDDSVCPWVIHLHLNKNIMSRKGVTTPMVIDVLEKNDSMINLDDKMDEVLKLHILCWECQLIDRQGEDNNMVCLTVAAETCLPTSGIDKIKDLIPVLLQTVIRGFKQYPKVDILWDGQTDPGRLYSECSGVLSMKVTILDSCKTKKFWSDLQDACLQITELIDWEHSLPCNVCDVALSHGIGSAWKYFLENLRTAIADLGRNIHDGHLHLLADCFMATGQICGLSSKGIKNQRNHYGIDAPFHEACFSRPASAFINAAKERAEDHLLGTIEALTWGKEIPIGTGAPFSIMYPKMVPDIDKPVNIYQSVVSQPFCGMCDAKPAKRKFSSSKWKQSLFSTNGCKFQRRYANGHSSDKKPGMNITGDFIDGRPLMKPMSGSKILLDQMRGQLRKILNRNPMGSSLNVGDATYIMEALAFHPRSKMKIGCGIKEIKIGHHPLHPETRCFILVREDGTIEDFSYIKCVIGAAKQNFA